MCRDLVHKLPGETAASYHPLVKTVAADVFAKKDIADLACASQAASNPLAAQKYLGSLGYV